MAIGELLVTASSIWTIQTFPGAAALLVLSTDNPAVLSHLRHWAPTDLLNALQLMSGSKGAHPVVRAYALRSLHTCPPEQVSFAPAQS